MLNVPFHPPIPPLWTDDQVDVRDDGFLIVKADNGILDPAGLPHQQPLLLHSAERFLKALYPTKQFSEILTIIPEPLSVHEHEVVGQPENTGDNASTSTNPVVISTDSNDTDDPMNIDDVASEGGASSTSLSVEEEQAEESTSKGESERRKETGTRTNKKAAPNGNTYQQVYQHLTRCDNLGNQIQRLITDISLFRHVPIKQETSTQRLSRDEAKVQALEKQQQHLLRAKSTGTCTSTSSGEIGLSTDDDPAPPVDNSEHNSFDNHDDDEDPLAPTEPDIVRLIRTINTIRAVLPHLLQIIHHKRRNDRNLIIGSVGFPRKRRASCWILGSHVFDTTSNKVLINTHKDCVDILQGHISADLADQIANDPMGGPFEFWSKAWALELRARASPSLQDPLAILASYGDAPTPEAIKQHTQKCDQQLHFDNTDSNTNEIHAKYETAVKKLHQIVSKLLKDRFPDARVSIYGSCLSNLSLGKGADVDLSLWFSTADNLQAAFHEGRVEAKKYEKQMKSFVYQVFDKLKSRGQEFRDLHPVTRARVPVVTGTYCHAQNPYSIDGSINFDICFLNDIAVANSGLLREYSLIDPRVRKLMMAVKLWANEHQINSAKTNYISSYAWMNLVIFYLQCICFVPNLQNSTLMAAVGFVPDPKGNIWHCVNKLDTWFLTWDQIQAADAWSQPSHLSEVSVSALLYGFFEFYSRRFPRVTFVVSIKEGIIRKPKLFSKKSKLFFSIEDPFETFDSHWPHDLSIPASESGTREMLTYFRTAERHLRDIILGNSQSEKLWPEHTIVSIQPTETLQKQNHKHFGKNQGHGKEQTGRKGGRGSSDRRRGGGHRQKPNFPHIQSQNAKQQNKTHMCTIGQSEQTPTGPSNVFVSKSTEGQTKTRTQKKDDQGTTGGTGSNARRADRKSAPAPYNGKPRRNRHAKKQHQKNSVTEPPKG